MSMSVFVLGGELEENEDDEDVYTMSLAVLAVVAVAVVAVAVVAVAVVAVAVAVVGVRPRNHYPAHTRHDIPSHTRGGIMQRFWRRRRRCLHGCVGVGGLVGRDVQVGVGVLMLFVVRCFNNNGRRNPDLGYPGRDGDGNGKYSR
ncbi:hypothetical protein ACMFMG_004908 [Clarireedia jacksonii]